MNDPNLDFSGNVQRFSGFAGLYDQFRPAPPAMMADVLTRLANAPQPELVVDLGSGTGLSSRYWAGRAGRVIGVEPTADMRSQAQTQTRAHNVTYREGFSHHTGLPDGCANIVTCMQSLHWMEPAATFQEVARILLPGGVFAACDYDWPPTTGVWQADAAYEACMAQVRAIEKAHPPLAAVRQWPKDGHLQRMKDSQRFRYVKEIVLHHEETGNAERLIGLLLSQGGVMTLLKAGLSEAQLGIDVFMRTVQQALGDRPRPWLWSARLRFGIV